MTRIAITGASTGLGEALAYEFAGSNVSFELCSRDIDKQEAVAVKLRKMGANASVSKVDVRIPESVANWCETIWERAPVDRLFINAGVFGGRSNAGRMEDPLQAIDLISANFSGAVVPGLIMAQLMRERGHGEIVFISSLAALTPMPDAPTYAATKTGISSFAASLREDLSATKVRVVTVHPGHIATAQTDQQIGRLPGLVSSEDAAKRIHRGLRKNRTNIEFPLAISIGLRVSRLLPRSVQRLIDGPLRFTVRPKQPPKH